MILVEAKFIDLVHLLVSTDVDATQVILHLLLGLEPLVTVLDLTLEFVFIDDLQVMHVDLDWLLEGREFNLACLHESFDSALIAEVGAAIDLWWLDL